MIDYDFLGIIMPTIRHSLAIACNFEDAEELFYGFNFKACLCIYVPHCKWVTSLVDAKKFFDSQGIEEV